VIKPLPVLILLSIILLLAWLNPYLSYLAGRLVIIAVALLIGLFFGSFFARRRHNQAVTFDSHFRYMVRLLLDRLG
jgi:uncharacterized protein YneF (UPF0154 family)